MTTISRRQFNMAMMAAMGSVLTRRVLAQAGGESAGMPLFTDALPPFPTVPGPIAPGPLETLQRKRLHAIDDLRLNAAGRDPRGNLDKITDAMVRLYQQVRAGGAQGGEIYFPQGTYAIQRCIRPLPDIAFVGESAAGSIIKNVSTDGSAYWNGSVICGGHDQPSEGIEGKQRYRPFAAIPREGDRHLTVNAVDYDQVRIGDEIKVIGATNAAATNSYGLAVRRPNFLVKVIITGKKAVGTDRILEIDRPLPWTLPNEGDDPWGDLRGQPVWFLVREWYVDALDYWQRKGQHGFEALTSKLGPQWGMGWTSRRNYFKNLTLWSGRGRVMLRGCLCDSIIENCVLKGYKCFGGNSMQYTQIKDCECRFTDNLAEISFNSLFTTIRNVSAAYDPSLNIDQYTEIMGMVTVHECSYGLVFDGLSVDVAGRKMTPKNTAFKISGSNNHFRKVRLKLPEMSNLIRIVPHTSDGKTLSPAHVTFRDMKIDMTGHGYRNLAAIEQASQHIGFAGVEVKGATAGTSVSNLRSNAIHDIVFADCALPGELTMTSNIKGVRVERCSFSGGIKGAYAKAVQLTPGKPDFARWS